MHCSSSYLYLHGGGLLVPLDHTVLGDKWSQFLSVHHLFHTHCVMVKDLREEGIGEEEKRRERKRGKEREERGERGEKSEKEEEGGGEEMERKTKERRRKFKGKRQGK